MRRVLGVLFLASLTAPALAADPAASPSPTPPAAPPAPVAAPASPAPPAPPSAVAPDVALPAPVPVNRVAPPATPEPPGAPTPPEPPVRIRIDVPAEALSERPRIQQGPVYTSLISEPPAIDPETASDGLVAWHDWIQAKKDRRIVRGGEVGGFAMIGIGLGSKSQAASIEGITEEQLAALQAWNDEGALVLSVSPGSPAEAAGILPGDIVVQFGGFWIDSTSLLRQLASRATVGRETEVWVLRGGEIETVWVTPGDRRDIERR